MWLLKSSDEFGCSKYASLSNSRGNVDKVSPHGVLDRIISSNTVSDIPHNYKFFTPPFNSVSMPIRYMWNIAACLEYWLMAEYSCPSFLFAWERWAGVLLHISIGSWIVFNFSMAYNLPVVIENRTTHASSAQGWDISNIYAIKCEVWCHSGKDWLKDICASKNYLQVKAWRRTPTSLMRLDLKSLLFNKRNILPSQTYSFSL